MKIVKQKRTTRAKRVRPENPGAEKAIIQKSTCMVPTICSFSLFVAGFQLYFYYLFMVFFFLGGFLFRFLW